MEYLDRDAQVSLLERLARGTVRGKYNWEVLDSDYVFTARAGKFAFVVSSRDRDDFSPFILDLHDLETVRKLQSIETNPSYPDVRDALDELYITVKRTTLKLDSVASDLFSTLDEIEGL